MADRMKRIFRILLQTVVVLFLVWVGASLLILRDINAKSDFAKQLGISFEEYVRMHDGLKAMGVSEAKIDERINEIVGTVNKTFLINRRPTP